MEKALERVAFSYTAYNHLESQELHHQRPSLHNSLQFVKAKSEALNSTTTEDNIAPKVPTDHASLILLGNTTPVVALVCIGTVLRPAPLMPRPLDVKCLLKRGPFDCTCDSGRTRAFAF